MASEHETAEDYDEALKKQRETEHPHTPDAPPCPPETPTPVEPDQADR